MLRLKIAMRWLAPVLGVLTGLVADAAGMDRMAVITLGITVLTALWWMFEAIPIPIASLVPIALLPLFGVLEAKTAVAQSYGHPLILLLMGGFFLSKGMEKSGVHRRLAIGMVRICGGQGRDGKTRPKFLMLGFMVAAAVLSMWISNTATTLMLLPIALAILDGDRTEGGVNPLAAPLMMSIAYAASVGGLGSPIGTPPNLVFIEQYREATGIEMTFSQWMAYGVPVVVIMLPLMWLWLSRNQRGEMTLNLPDVGAWRSAERRTLVVFGLTALAWMTRAEPFGGWSSWLGLAGANDASVAFVGVMVLFLVPDGSGRKGEVGRLLDWETCKEVPWGVLLLFSGGICLAAGIKDSGLSSSIAGALAGVGTLPVLALVLTVCLLMTFLTELTSNTASTILIMPILATVAISSDIDPLLVMLPAALSASCAFMLPVATAPNAVVFGSGHLTVPKMMREGVVLNLIGVVVISAYCWLRS
ncbi:MAG: sodium-dependent dicarboxylate transporter 2/3/5 [Paracoccaceae bacterium]|jgi:sodium-dependent dicarboxylate transporter 2/3/5